MDEHGRTHLDELRAAQPIGAEDIFLFRRVAGGRFVHVGGIGRGRGWAGNVDLLLDDEPLVRAAWSAGEPRRVDTPELERVFGPYYARSAIVVPVDSDVIAVFGSPAAHLPSVDEADLRAAAREAGDRYDHVTPAKRLADELEVLHAVKALLHCEAEHVDDALAHIARTAAASLSCEIAAVHWIAGDRTVVHRDGWDGAGDAALAAALRDLARTPGTLPRCTQDVDVDPLPAPLTRGHGVRATYVLPIGADPVAVLVLAHTEATPRGFTELCQLLGLRLAEAAESVIRTAVIHSSLQDEIVRMGASARRDPLTGLANRLAWDEAVAAQQADLDLGGCCSVLMIDQDGLKAVNDGGGHAIGDRLLRALARLLDDAVGSGGTVARIGGDEFGVLLPHACTMACAEVVASVEAALAAAPDVAGHRLSASIGAASCGSGDDLIEALCLADARMYAAKAEQR